MFFELVSILFAIVPDYGNDCMTKENNNWTSFKNFAPKINLNHNIYTTWKESHDVGVLDNLEVMKWPAMGTINSAVGQKVDWGWGGSLNWERK